MGRQLRIDEDVQGRDDAALDGLIWMGEYLLRSDHFHGEKLARLQADVERLHAEKLRRSKLVRA